MRGGGERNGREEVWGGGEERRGSWGGTGRGGDRGRKGREKLGVSKGR